MDFVSFVKTVRYLRVPVVTIQQPPTFSFPIATNVVVDLTQSLIFFVVFYLDHDVAIEDTIQGFDFFRGVHAHPRIGDCTLGHVQTALFAFRGLQVLPRFRENAVWQMNFLPKRLAKILVASVPSVPVPRSFDCEVVVVAERKRARETVSKQIEYT